MKNTLTVCECRLVECDCAKCGIVVCTPCVVVPLELFTGAPLHRCIVYQVSDAVTTQRVGMGISSLPQDPVMMKRQPERVSRPLALCDWTSRHLSSLGWT